MECVSRTRSPELGHKIKQVDVPGRAGPGMHHQLAQDLVAALKVNTALRKFPDLSSQRDQILGVATPILSDKTKFECRSVQSRFGK